MFMVYMSINEACKYLARHAEDKKSEQQWFGYLKNNARKFMEQDGYKIVSHVVKGELCFTEASLKSFIKTMGNPTQRTSVAQALNAVDLPKPKKKGKSKKKGKVK